jgi:predicted nucleotidyltransferase
MENIVKKTREVGTSAGVLLPRKWLNRQVSVTLLSFSIEEIAKEVFDILLEQNLNEEVKGIYLAGSYSRGDYDINSDIDILVITSKVNSLINKRNYEILLVSEDNFSKNLPCNLNFLSMLKEIKTIMNKELVEGYIKRVAEQKLNFKDFKKNLTEIRGVLKINKESVKICDETKRNVPDGVVYSIVLRLRELFLIKCLLSDTSYSRNNFIKTVGDNIYSAYIRVKRDEKELNNIAPKEIKNLLDLSEKWLKELKR